MTTEREAARAVAPIFAAAYARRLDRLAAEQQTDDSDHERAS